MSSDESDNEPLSVLAKNKLSPVVDNKNDSENIQSEGKVKKKKKKKKKKSKKLKLKLKLDEVTHKLRNVILPPQVRRPQDVWLYLKDFSQNGPFSCLLCPEWFINKSKIVLHYIINHKKDYCGICRYFVSDHESWVNHKQFHVPWNCSQCNKGFPTELELRSHFSTEHTLVHCRLCYFMLPDNEEYHSHLFQKHNVTNVAKRNENAFWELEYEEGPKFLCLLCTNANVLVVDFFRHFMCYHRFTLKCFSSLISGNDVPFPIYGANISPGFLENQIQENVKCGYVDLKQKVTEDNQKPLTIDENHASLLDALIPEIKQEIHSDNDEIRITNIIEDEATKQAREEIMKYEGEEDYDITLTELIVLEGFYYNYIECAINDIQVNYLQKSSQINYKLERPVIMQNVVCPICPDRYENISEFVSHFSKMHCGKTGRTFSCRLCLSGFDIETEYSSHMVEELSEFEGLWLCQFCDREFEGREAIRDHLIQHIHSMTLENCFSPHMGFKCGYCPILFWNEPERERHHSEAHYEKYKERFYKCSLCNDIYSDKVWFTHHYMKCHLQQNMEMPLYLVKCSICAVVLLNADDMKIHFQSSHPEARKIFCCLDPCKYKPLSHLKSFKIHVKTLHGPKPNNSRQTSNGLTCSLCGRDFASNKALGTHIALSHGPGRFKCKFCTDTMHSLDERKLHYLLRHPGRHHFECTICFKTFQYKSSLYIHRSEQHSTNKVTYTCDMCQKEFSKKDSYREHLMIHEGPRHACSYCPMRFVQRSNMLRHERRHTGERPYSCTECGRTFADKGACNSHMRIHSRDEIFPCVYCGQTFVQKSKLKYHLRKHTGENLETCPVCSKLYTNTYALREHLKTHAEKSPTKCPICNKTYTNERSIMRHVQRMHHENTPQVCPVCKKTLSTVVGLRQHLITHSKRKPFQCLSCSKTYSIRKSMVKHLKKRHNIKGLNVRPFYKQLDIRECQLGLDEDVITGIFGRSKYIGPEVMIDGYVSFPPPIEGIDNKQTDNQKDNLQDNSDNDSDNGNDNGEANSDDESSGAPDEDTKIIPPRFVCVKIEPIDEDDVDDEEEEK